MFYLKGVLVSSTVLLVIHLTVVTSEMSSESVLIRSPRSIGNIFRRLFGGKRKQTGFQGTAQANQPYSYGSYGQASQPYPSYSMPLYPGVSYNPNVFQNGYQSYSGYPMATSASSQYGTYSPPATYSAQPYGQSPGTIDVHQVLDQFIRSAGLSPQGDHEAQGLQAKGDSFAQSGTQPVFSFKKLYSFPFYMSADPNAAENFNNFYKRNTRRMSPEAQQLQHILNQQLLAKQFLIPPVIKNEQNSHQSEQHRIQSEKQSQDYMPAEDVEQQL